MVDRQKQTPLESTINGEHHEVIVDHRRTVLDVLREDLFLTGTKKGCDRDQCGARTVPIDGQRALSCLRPAVTDAGAELTTVEGLATEQRGRGPRDRPAWHWALLEMTLAASLWVLYGAGRMLAKARSEVAFANATWIRDFESNLRLPSEASLQDLLGSPDLYRVLNIYYISAHFPVSIAFLILLFLCWPRAKYVWVRNQMAVMTLMAMAVHIAFPAAPPRMFPKWGFVDAMKVYGPDAYGPSSVQAANQMAAMPSLHIGWAALIAYVAWRAGPTWLRLPATAHALITTAVVIITANHWWLDGVAAIISLAVAAVMFPHSEKKRPEPKPTSLAALSRKQRASSAAYEKGTIEALLATPVQPSLLGNQHERIRR